MRVREGERERGLSTESWRSCERWERRRVAVWLRIRCGHSEGVGEGRGSWGGGRLVPSGRGVDTAEQLTTVLLDDRAAAAARSLFWSPPQTHLHGQMTMSPSTSVSGGEGEQVA